MIRYIHIITYILTTLLLIGCGGGTKKSLDKTPPNIELRGENHITLALNQTYLELGATAYDNRDSNITISVSNNIQITKPGSYCVTYRAIDTSGNKAIKEREVEVINKLPEEAYTTPSNLQSYIFKVDSQAMQSIPIGIKSSHTIQIIDNTTMRANSISLQHINDTYILRNDSYKNMKNLIGQYRDEDNLTHLVKLTFDIIIKSHTAYILKDFMHEDTMQVYQTSELFNQAVRFEGEICDDTMDNTSQVKYCHPTPREQNNYELLLANLHSYYNSRDGLDSFIAWKNEKNYHSIDLTSTFQNFKEMQESNLIHSFLKATLPNNQIDLKTSRYVEDKAGVGSGEDVSLLGIKKNKGWASLSQRYINFSAETMLEDTNVYTLFHHELMHAHGFSHTSGMTIGFSNALGKVITQLYPSDTMPIFEVPKYVFEVHFEKNKQMHLTLYHTSEDYSDKLTIELLSVEALSIKQLPSNENSKIIIESKRRPSMRFFLRLYGEDSSQVMSKLIYPYVFSQLSSEINRDNIHTIIPSKNWQYLSKYNTEHLQMTPRDSEAFCKAWMGNDKAHTLSLNNVKIWEEGEISLLLHSPSTYKIYYIVKNGEYREIRYDSPMEERTISIACTAK